MKTRNDRPLRTAGEWTGTGDDGATAPAAPMNDPPAPQVLRGRYQLERELGHGAMGRVFAATDLQLGRTVAIKILRGERDARRERRLEQEARTAGALNHRNIVAVHDFGTDECGPYVVTELLEGETLRAILARGPLPVRQALALGAQLARGLSAAHRKGIVHRDVKPENLFVAPDGQLKILDFGIARFGGPESQPAPADVRVLERSPDAATVSTNTRTDAFAGTVPYMSPEQVRGEAVDARSDVFSAGAVLYEMLSGKAPFTAATDVATAFAIVRSEPPALRNVPEEAAAIVKRCLQKAPADRFPSADDLAAALEATQGPRLSTEQRLLLVGLGLALVVAVLLAILLRGRHTAPPSIRQVTFDQGLVGTARFAPDGDTVVYSVATDGPPELRRLRLGASGSETLLRDAALVGMSRNDALALLLHPRFAWFDWQLGTLAERGPGANGALREIAESAEYADYGPDGSLAVVRVNGARRVLERSGKVLYETAGWISDPRFSRSGDRIAFVDHPDPAGDDAGSIMLVDLDGNRRSLGQRWKSAQGLAWSPSDSEVWFTAAEEDVSFTQNSLHALDLDGRVRKLAPATGRLKLEDVSRSGKVLVTQRNARVAIQVLSDGAPLRDLSWLELPMLDDLSPDGTTILVTEHGAGAQPGCEAFLRRTDGSPPASLGSGLGAALSPDGKRVLILPCVAGAPGVPSLVTVGSGARRSLTGLTSMTVAAARFFPDGRRLAVLGAMPGQPRALHVVDTATGARTDLGAGEVSRGPMAVSVDGKWIAATGASDVAWLYPATGGSPRPIRGSVAGDRIAGFDRGGAVFVWQRLDSPARIFRLDPRDGTRTEWKKLALSGTVARTQVTPDERTLVFNASSQTAQLYVIDGLE